MPTNESAYSQDSGPNIDNGLGRIGIETDLRQLPFLVFLWVPLWRPIDGSWTWHSAPPRRRTPRTFEPVVIAASLLMLLIVAASDGRMSGPALWLSCGIVFLVLGLGLNWILHRSDGAGSGQGRDRTG